MADARSRQLPVGVGLRLRASGWRSPLRLAIFRGELSLEAVTAALSDFADRAVHHALTQAITERTPGEPVAGLTVLALGKLGSRELNYRSDVDLILLFDPETVPRRARDEPGAAATRLGRRLVELLQERTATATWRGCGRPASSARPRSSRRSRCLSAPPFPIMKARRCRGSGRPSSGRVRRRGPRARRALPRRDPAFRLAPGARFRAIDDIREISLRIRDHYAQGQQFGPGLSDPASAGAAASARRSSSLRCSNWSTGPRAGTAHARHPRRASVLSAAGRLDDGRRRASRALIGLFEPLSTGSR